MAEFKCEISMEGLKASWLKDDKTIKSGDTYKMVDETTVHKLIIEKAYAEDEAEYTVVFREDAKSSAKLTINGELAMENHLHFKTYPKYYGLYMSFGDY